MHGSCFESFPSNAYSAPLPQPSAQANIWNASFPAKLHLMLEYAEEMGMSHIVSWLPHGRAFRIHDDALFMSCVAGSFFKATKMRSIHRQLHLWGFTRVHSGQFRDAWHHEHFARGRPDDILTMVRTKYKGGRKRQSFLPAAFTTEDRSAKEEAAADCIVYATSTTDINGQGKTHLVSPGAGRTRPSSSLPRPTIDPPALALALTSHDDGFGPHSRVCTLDLQPLQNWTIEPLPVDFGNEKAQCNVVEDEFSQVIGMLIKDPSDQ